MQYRSVSLILALALVLGCSNAKKSASTEEVKVAAPQVEEQAPVETKEPAIASKPVKAQEPRVVPGQVSGCSVEATILDIDPTLDLTSPQSPCGKVPCSALIRINKIVKMGQQCGPHVVPGATLKAFFKYTLGNTHELFPDMKRHFPGLEKSDTFAATFMATAYQSNDDQIVIYVYTKTE